MQARIVLEKTGCPEPTFKDWLKNQVIIPSRPGNGPGMHAEYDDANLIVLALALRMKECAVVVAKYSSAFQELHRWLRSTSKLEWSGHFVVMTPESASVVASGQWESSVGFGYAADLGLLYRSLQSVETSTAGRQQLLSLETVW